MRQADRRSGRIRAMRVEDPQATIAARVDALRPFIGGTGEEKLASLRRLLRSERRAARAGGVYDAARHAALCRLVAEAQRPARPRAK
ncbi:hypothetical protein MKI84_12790 [Ancylobacter sp. A5.8]|uniref:hypothetical protein n=1 Tax=Ancylobacter gelatini TaxID=2919920 RepID=UPI001F4E3701|nr:hypothetical protein [Ancylobacter gelatini]MCJ8143793.1 hypothetical protein [Ancylobacter gelatini]